MILPPAGSRLTALPSPTSGICRMATAPTDASLSLRASGRLRIMLRNKCIGWAGAVVTGSITGIVLSAEWLPRRVASHFAASGLADGFMARNVYVAFMVGLVALLSVATSVLMNRLLRRPGLVYLNSDYLLAADLHDEAERVLTAHVAWLAAGPAALVFGIHLLLIRANHFSPPRFELIPFLSLL